MFQTIRIFSSLIVLWIISLFCFILGLIRYRSRKEEPGTDLDQRTVKFILFGNIGLAYFGSLLLFLFIQSRTILLALLLGGTILFLIGELTLRKLIIAGKNHLFALSITTIGASSAMLLFPLVINMHEPFIAIYVCLLCIALFIQRVLLSSWKSKRVPKKSLSTSEEAEPH